MLPNTVRPGLGLFAPITLLAAAGLAGCSNESESQQAAEAARAAAEVAAEREAVEFPASAQAADAGNDEWEPYEGVFRAGVREVPPKPDNAVRLTSYNVLNLFDEQDDPALSGDADDMHDRWDNLRAKPAGQLQAVADAIRAIDVDVIGLQEIESEQALLWFRDNYLADMGYEHVLSEDVQHARGIEQSVLSRFPIVEHRTWPREPLGANHPEDPALMQSREREKAGQEIVFRRSPLFALVEIPAGARGNDQPYELGLFVVHHKSGRVNDYWRDAEAARIRELIAEMQTQHPDRNIALLGDFNATPGAASVRSYSEQLGFIDTLADRSVGDTASLTHASGRAIDFIFVNPAMERELVPGSAFVYATPLRPREFDWRTTPTPIGYAADHMPVTMDLVPVDR